MSESSLKRLAEAAPEIERILMPRRGAAPRFEPSIIRRETIWVTMRDGVRLATELYYPPLRQAPAIAVRTPYGRTLLDKSLSAFAQHGYVAVSQDCRGTGDSEPDTWDTYIYEREDSIDCVEWITQQEWYDGFIGSCGGSYVGSTQWAMAMHPCMSAIAPEVAGLVISPADTPRSHMFINAYSRSQGKGADKVPVPFWELERQMLGATLTSGYFNEPLDVPLRQEILARYPDLCDLPRLEGKRRLWDVYRAAGPSERAELVKLALGHKSVTMESLDELTAIFGHHIPIGLIINPSSTAAELARSLHAPALILTGWYDWSVGDTLASWELLMREGSVSVRGRSRLLIAPSAHNMPGYREGRESHPELDLTYRTSNSSERTGATANIQDLLLRWYKAVRDAETDSWPTVIYYLMGANEWYAASAWPPAEARVQALYLGSPNALTPNPSSRSPEPDRDQYTYNPSDPTPTVGGSIVSYVYRPGSVDVNAVQRRRDVLSYTTPPLDQDLDVVGPLRMVLYVSSSAVDTDFAARLSDVFPDGRAIQLQNGVLRARYRNTHGDAELLEPGRIYRVEIDMGGTANRFKAGHCLRLDISSADFPKFDRNTNRGGAPGDPIAASQTIYHDPEHPSHLLVSIIDSARCLAH